MWSALQGGAPARAFRSHLVGGIDVTQAICGVQLMTEANIDLVGRR